MRYGSGMLFPLLIVATVWLAAVGLCLLTTAPGSRQRYFWILLITIAPVLGPAALFVSRGFDRLRKVRRTRHRGQGEPTEM
jgi:hypothetical protein